MKKLFKDMLPVTILAFLASFLIYIYEPIITYSTNINDFWFDFKLMLPNILSYFALLFLIIWIFYNYIYLFCSAIKKEGIFKVIMIISFIVLAFTYVEGTFLSGSLPTLDGEIIEWGSYTKENIQSIIVLLILIVAEIFCVVKYKLDQTLKINNFVMCAIFVMLLTTFSSALMKPEFFKEKIISVPTDREINQISTNKNYIILLADAVDSIEFAIVTDDEEIFEDFTYYPDTVSGYTFTRDSIPFIFSGVWNKNETDFSEYSTKSFNESKVFKALRDEDYSMHFYEDDLTWYSRDAAEMSNIDIYNNKIESFSFFKQLTKYSLFKYLPYPLKKYSKIEYVNFDLCKVEGESKYFDWYNPLIYSIINDNDLEKIDQNYFQFLHIEGGHVPFDNDEDVNEIPSDEGTYDQKLKATAKVIKAYLERLKESDVYDNSVIVVLADHGYWTDTNARQNPILYIKGFDEHHEMYTSDLPISYEDLPDAFISLIDGSKSEDLFQDIDTSRIRKFIYNGFGHEEVMQEYEQRGQAWDRNEMVETGVEFVR